MKQRPFYQLVFITLLSIFQLTACGKSSAARRKEIAEKKCSLEKKVADIGLLNKFYRKRGVFYIENDRRIWTIVTVDHAEITMPALVHSEVSILHKPFAMTQFLEKRQHITIDIYTLYHNDRRFLRYIATPENTRKYGNRSFFSYLDEALGVYTHGYCNTGNPEKSIAMFMARAATVLPIGSKDSVYQIKHPRALLVVTESMDDAEIMFPAKSPDAITYEYISAPDQFITSLVDSLSKQSS